MKTCFVLLGLLACRILVAAETPTNLLSISLVIEKESPSLTTAIMPKPEELKLMSPPVLADKDFVAFDMTNQTFTITPEAAKRLAAKLCELAGTQPYVFKSGEYELIPYPTPFVLQASGDSVYVGAFYTETSSSA